MSLSWNGRCSWSFRKIKIACACVKRSFPLRVAFSDGWTRVRSEKEAFFQCVPFNKIILSESSCWRCSDTMTFQRLRATMRVPTPMTTPKEPNKNDNDESISSGAGALRIQPRYRQTLSRQARSGSEPSKVFVKVLSLPNSGCLDLCLLHPLSIFCDPLRFLLSQQ